MLGRVVLIFMLTTARTSSPRVVLAVAVFAGELVTFVACPVTVALTPETSSNNELHRKGYKDQTSSEQQQRIL